MAAITNDQVTAYTDKAVALYLAGIGNTPDGMGTFGGTFGASKKAQDIEGLVLATEDYDIVGTLAAATRALRNACDGRVVLSGLMSGWLLAMNQACAAAGAELEVEAITDLNSFATYFNLTETTKWDCLFAPDFYDIYSRALNALLSEHNTYFEVLQGATYTNGLAKFQVGGGLTLGATIDSAKYAGGFGQLDLNSITSSAPDVVTVAGTFRKTDGTTATGDATATISSGTSSPAALTPPFTDALLLSVSNITVAAGITGGTIYVEAARPAGRTNPPT